MKPAEGCALFGAYRACVGISDAVILLHSVVGCHFGTLFFHQTRQPEDVRQASTVFYGSEVLYGGADALVKALQNADALYQRAKVFIVLSGCVPNMVGDDVEAAIREAGLSRPVIHVPVPGTAGDMTSGYAAALLALASHMKPKRVGADRINLLGLSVDDFLAEGDMAALQTLLGSSVRLRCIAVGESFADFCRAPDAALNVVFGSETGVADYMRAQFGTPYIVARYPYGVHGSEAFLWQMANALPEVDAASAVRMLRRRVRPVLARMSFYLRLLYGMPTAIFGDSVRSEGLRAFLTEELGMDPVVYHAGGRTDMEALYEQAAARHVPLLFGSSFDRGWCDEHGAALVRVFYPVFDEIVFSRRSFLGVDGFYTLTETIVNVLQRQTLQRKRLYEGIVFPTPEGSGA